MKLIDLITREFSDVPRLGTGQIADRDSSPVSLEALAVEEFFSPLTWSDVTWDVLSNYRGDKTACLFFMNSPAFLYFFPAYMTMTLIDTHAITGLLHPIVSLTYERETGARFFNLMQSEYDAQKKRCIGYFLLEINQRYVASYGPLHPDAPLPLEPGELLPEEIAFQHWLNVGHG